jgi:hypothetical protein
MAPQINLQISRASNLKSCNWVVPDQHYVEVLWEPCKEPVRRTHSVVGLKPASTSNYWCFPGVSQLCPSWLLLPVVCPKAWNQPMTLKPQRHGMIAFRVFNMGATSPMSAPHQLLR